MEPRTRILIVDDYPAVRADLRTILELVEGVEVLGACAGISAPRLAAQTHPDIILIDLDRNPRSAAQMSSADLLQRIKAHAPTANVFVLSAAEYPAGGPNGLPAGADALFIKGTDTGQLLDRVRTYQIQKERNVPMQQTSDLQIGSFEQVKPAAIAKAKAGARLAYIDTLRMVLIILVIMVHAAVTYGSLGSWTYEDPVQEELSAVLLSLFVIACQAFFMGLLFFFAGYFTPGSYDRKGLPLFWKDRLLRLFVPMAAYTWVLSKVPNYINAVANQGLELTFGQYFIQYFTIVQDEGPTWFLFALLVFSAGYTLWRLATHSAGLSSRLTRVPAPNRRTLLAVGLLMAALTFAVSQLLPLGEMADVFAIFSLQFQFFPTYIILFAAGSLAFRSGWLSQLPGSTLRFWAWISAALLITLPALMILGGAPDGYLDAFMSGLNWRCAALCLWLGLACIAFSMTLTLWLRDRVHSSDRLAAFAGRNNFTVYLIHPLVLVPISWGLSFLAMPSLVKFGLASVFTVALCCLLAVPLRRLPGMKSIL